MDHPFFRPRWRRIAVVAFCTGWAVFEWITEAPFWAILASALALYTYYSLILTFDPRRAEAEDRDL